jgi:hypothetical protein
MKNQRGNVLFPMILIGLVLGFIGAWLTHIITCLTLGKWGFLIAGAIFFPIGMVHGVGIWFGWF